MSVYMLKKTSSCQFTSNFHRFNLAKSWYDIMGTNATVTMETKIGHDDDTSDIKSGFGYIIMAGILCTVAMVAIVAVVVYRFFHKRSSPLWITKFYHQDQYSTMKNDEAKDDQFIIGFSNPMTESTDNTDNSIQALSYRPLDVDKSPDDQDQYQLQYKFLFPRAKITYGPEIGSGWFGRVYKGEATRIVPGLRKTKIIIKKLREDSTSEQRKRFLDEIAMFKSWNHENVLEVLGVATEQQPYLIVFEYNPLGNLKEYLLSHQSEHLSIKQRLNPLRMSIDIGSGLQFLHSKCFYHSDLAARNCIVNSDLSVKIGDYGISRDLHKNDYYEDSKSSKESLPIRWLDPESVSFDKDSGITVMSLTAKENVWSYGITLWEIVECGRQPYAELTDDEVLQTVIVDRLYQLPEPRDTGILASQLYDMMKWCWADAARRPSIEDILDFLKGLAENIQDLLDQEEEHTVPTTNNDYKQPVAIVRPLQHCETNKTSETNKNSETSETNKTNETSETKECVKKRTLDKTKEQGASQAMRSEGKTLENEPRDKAAASDVEVTAICDDVPVTAIHSESLQENELRKKKDELVTPVTYIGGPLDDEHVQAQGSQEGSGDRLTDVNHPSEESVVVQESSCSYVVLPGETLRRKSSIRGHHTQSRGHTVHFPANILDLRVIHRYYPEPWELEEQQENDQDEEDGESMCDGSPPTDSDFIFDFKDEKISLHDEGLAVDDNSEIGSALILDRPTSPVEKRVRKATRRQPLNKNADEWLFSIDKQEQ